MIRAVLIWDEAYKAEAKACSEQEVSSDEEVAADKVQNGNDDAFDSEEWASVYGCLTFLSFIFIIAGSSKTSLGWHQQCQYHSCEVGILNWF